jgi:hypothetical protein
MGRMIPTVLATVRGKDFYRLESVIYDAGGTNNSFGAHEIPKGKFLVLFSDFDPLVLGMCDISGYAIFRETGGQHLLYIAP